MLNKILKSKVNLSNLPTPIEKLSSYNQINDTSIWIKRDDYTGSELTGNKVRKLDYLLYDAIQNGADTIITCGGEQSNHARATAISAAKLGLKSILVLRTFGNPKVDGNVLLDGIIGSTIKWITPEEYSSSRSQIMSSLKDKINKSGGNAYIIPEGGSNAIGALGYINALDEIKQQQDENSIEFDEIICAVGSGGTLAGLIAGKKLLGINAKITGINVCDDASYFIKEITKIGKELSDKFGFDNITSDEINIIDGFVGKGYAKASDAELITQIDFATKTGIILDPVYSGKAFHGMMQSILNNNIKSNNILFIHTGGIYGIFSFKDQYEKLI